MLILALAVELPTPLSTSLNENSRLNLASSALMDAMSFVQAISSAAVGVIVPSV
jgi:hypothetical protein